MPRSERLRLSDITQAFRLIGEVRELGNDLSAWRKHLAAGLNRLTDSHVAVVGEVDHGRDWRRPGVPYFACGSTSSNPPLWPIAHPLLSLEDVGWASAAARATWIHCVIKYPPTVDPLWAYYCCHLVGTAFTHARRELITDYDWHSSIAYAYRRKASTDDVLDSSQPLLRRGWHSHIQIMKPLGGVPFTERQRRVVQLLHGELGRLWQQTARREPGMAPVELLPRRLRQTLVHLRNGMSEKEVASALGLSRHTVHNYVRALHKRFNASNRAELLSKSAPTTHQDFIPKLAFQ